jgi:hypothetical protein
MHEKLLHAITYAYPKSKIMGSFCSVNDAVFAAAIADEKIATAITTRGESAVQQAAAQAERTWLADREVIRAFKTDEPALSPTAAKILHSLQINDQPHALQLQFGWLPAETCDIYRHGNRNVRTLQKNTTITADTAFELRNRFNAYGTEAYGLALIFAGYAIAFEGCDAGTGTMGAYTLRVTEATAEKIVIDSASKYIDIAPFVRGLH